MSLYIIWAIGGIVLLLLELMTPALFFLNLAAGAFFAAIFAYFYPAEYWLHVFVFTLISALCILFLRPMMLKNTNNSENFDAKYVGREAKVVKTIRENEGKIKIYDEEWVARSKNNEEIEEGTLVKIVDTKDLVMYVEKL